MLNRLSALSVRRPRTVLCAWAMIVVSVAAAVLMFGRPTDDTLSLPGTDAQYAADLQVRAFPGEGGGSSGTLVLHAGQGTLDDAARREALDRTVRQVGAVEHVTRVVPASVQAGSVSADGRTGYLTVELDLPAREVDGALVQRLEAAAAPVAATGVEVMPGGRLAAAAEREGSARSEAFGLVLALVVLLVGFGSAVAAGLPVVSALVGLLCGLGAVGLLGHLASIPSTAATLATMIGLGVGIDYALFLLSRHRSLLAEGRPVPEAVRETVGSSGASVVFAGITVVIALSGLAISGIPVLRTLAWTTGLVVAVAVLTAVTFLPALLTLLGERVNALRVFRRRDSVEKPSVLWGRLADRVTGRPWRVLLGSVVLLGALTAPAVALDLGQVDAGSDQSGNVTRQAYELLEEGFGPGANGPLTVVAETDGRFSGPADPALTAFAESLRGTKGVASAGEPRVSPDGSAAVVKVVPATAPSDPATADLVERIRRPDVPGLEQHVGGPVAAKADLAALVSDRMPVLIGTVLGLCGLVLLLAFRAPVVAAKAVVMNLVSIGAAYGVLTAVFTWGWGAAPLGLEAPVPIEGYVPMMMFAVLFGLSMDYEVFLLTAVRESRLRHGDDRRAVRDGLAGTARVISSAALIMVGVFAGFLLHPDPVIKMFGVGLAAGVVVDALLVRGLLVPSTMALLGRANWWTPAWLARLPDPLAGHVPPGGQGSVSSRTSCARVRSQRAASSASSNRTKR
ncbi:MMPL family transporter [Actinocorallia sp. B10E7]|uniref:MMPL family transporter n=1 Tax=Actinocorallia sp. B10E7 TaxID=3153558 RepID=UPI00325DEA98